MKERPILFSTEMVQAILSGRKTMTRRVVKPQPEWVDGLYKISLPGWFIGSGKQRSFHYTPDTFGDAYCPYGVVGDRLWVREAWAIAFEKGLGQYSLYRADEAIELGFKWRSSIHMPRAASRITLEITGVRVERLQDVSAKDAIAEGFKYTHELPELWDSLNAERGYSWDSNPWVWVIEFKRVEVERD